MAFDGDKRSLPIRITTILSVELIIVVLVENKSGLTRLAQCQSLIRNVARAAVRHPD